MLTSRRQQAPYTLTLEEASAALNVPMGRLRELAQKGALDARKFPDGRYRNVPRWYVSTVAVEDYKRNGLPEPLTIPPGFRWTVPDLGEAMRNGELDDLGPESVRAFVRAKRAAAIKEWEAKQKNSAPAA
jgi:hypothetical protein